MSMIRSGLQPLLAICALKPFELDGCLCIGDAENATVNRWAFEGDPTGFEAFVNHVHLAEFWDGHASPESDVALLHAIARLVVSSWAVSLLPLLGGRSVLFYAGGKSIEDFTVRFHVDRRPESSWVDLRDRALLQEHGIRAWRLDVSGLREAGADADSNPLSLLRRSSRIGGFQRPDQPLALRSGLDDSAEKSLEACFSGLP